MQVWPLVGREQELGRIAAAIDRPLPAGVVLVGASGVGKTRLATEALNLARARGATVEWAVATEAAASIPFGPVAHLLPPTGEDAASLLDLLRHASDSLADRARGGRIVIGVDDAHLLDRASAALIHHLVLSSAASVLITLRTHASPPDAVTALWKDGLVEWLDVKPFSRRELESLAGVAVGVGSTARPRGSSGSFPGATRCSFASSWSAPWRREPSVLAGSCGGRTGCLAGALG